MLLYICGNYLWYADCAKYTACTLSFAVVSYLEYQSCRLGHDVFVTIVAITPGRKRDFVKSYLKPSFVGYRILGEKYLATTFIFMYILFGAIDELVTSSACHAEGRRFESG